ncbi:MAG: restriction endonuclease subunit S [Cytobacillus gottheilii]|uniref:restriction endonuclease subunit S n=1 Tax=Cytobacillus gottheilii TaxID=859144 RepID=UPI003463BAC3
MSKKAKKKVEEMLEEAIISKEDQLFNIPENWEWTKLGSIAEVVGGGTPKSNVKEYYDDGNIPWITPADLSGYNNMYINEGKRNITQLGLEKSSARLLPTNTVLLSSRAPIGYVVIAANEVSTNQGFKNFLPSAAIYPQFLYWYLKNSKAYLESMASGSTFKEISGSRCKNISFPLPPLNEQKRIADKVKLLLNKIEEAKQLIEEAKKTFELRRAAILDKAFSGELTARWRAQNNIEFNRVEYEIRELVSELNQGWSPKCESYPSVDNAKWGVIKTTAIQHMHFIEEENKQLPDTLEPKEQHELRAGDILITRAGPRIRVGVCCMIKQVRPKLLLCDKAYRIRANMERVLPEFLELALNTPTVIKKLNEMKTGISDSGVNLTQKGFLAIKLSVPSIEEQGEIIRIVNILFEKEARSLRSLESLEAIDTLKQAVLSKAFRGELGTNDPSEVSAIELLKEVLQEHAK